MKINEKKKKKAFDKERKIQKEKLEKVLNSGFFRVVTLFSSMFTFLFIGEYAKMREMNYISSLILFVMIVFFISNLSFILADKLHQKFHKIIQSTTMKAKSGSLPSFLFASACLTFLAFTVNPFSNWLMNLLSSMGLALFSWACVYQISSMYGKKPMVGTKPIEIFSLQTQGILAFFYCIYQLIQGIHYLGSSMIQWVGSFPSHIGTFFHYFSDRTGLPTIIVFFFVLFLGVLSTILNEIYEILLAHKTSTGFQTRYHIPFTKKTKVYFQYSTHIFHFSLFWFCSSCYTQINEKLIYGVAPLGLFLIMVTLIQVLWNYLPYFETWKGRLWNHPILARKENPFETNQYLKPIPRDVAKKFNGSNLQGMAETIEYLFPDV